MVRKAQTKESIEQANETKRRNKLEVRAKSFVGLHAFLVAPDGRTLKKPCAYCGIRFRPQRPGDLHRNGSGKHASYAVGMFCSEDCEREYIADRMRTLGTPRAVSQRIWGVKSEAPLYSQKQLIKMAREGQQ